MSVDSVAARADVVVAGAGPAGLGAAAELARRGLDVLVVDEQPAPGGRALGQVVEGGAARASGGWVEGLCDEARAAGARIRCGLSLWAVAPGWRVFLSPVDPARASASPAIVEARALVVATGAVERPIALPGWSKSGVLTLGGAERLLGRHALLPGERVAIVGLDALASALGRRLAEAGAACVCLVAAADGPIGDLGAVRAVRRGRPERPGGATPDAGAFLAAAAQAAAGDGTAAAARAVAVQVCLDWAALAIEGAPCARALRVAPVAADGALGTADAETWPVDAVILSGGLSPLAEAAELAGCAMAFVQELGGRVPVRGPNMETALPGLFVAGSAAGVGGREAAAAQGRLAGLAAARFLGALSADDGASLCALARADVRDAQGREAALWPLASHGEARMAALWAEGRDPG